MEALCRWAHSQGRVTVFVIGFAAFVGIQFAGYGIASKTLDFLCGLALGIVAAGFQYDFVDGIARLDTISRRQQRATDTSQQIKERIRVSTTGLLAFVFTSLSVVMLLRLFV